MAILPEDMRTCTMQEEVHSKVVWWRYRFVGGLETRGDWDIRERKK